MRSRPEATLGWEPTPYPRLGAPQAAWRARLRSQPEQCIYFTY